MNKTILKYLSAIGKKGGKKKSEKKTVACRENGKLGGRPRKTSALAEVDKDGLPV